MSRSRTSSPRAASRATVLSITAAVLLAGCGGGGSSGGEVVARASAPPDAAAGAGAVAAAGAEADAGVPDDFAGAAGAPPSGADAGIVIDVAGAVRRPGVYRMAPGARVHEAIQAAGGARRGAQLGTLNRAAVLVDGQQVLVGGPGTPAVGGAGVSEAPGGGTVNINSADVAALDALPGIGEVTAANIVASREEAGPFASLDDLDRVPGIGPATIESLRSVVTT